LPQTSIVTVARIDARFSALRAEGRAGFVAYVMGGDPDHATSLAIVRGLAAAGADLIEVGFPFSDPMAEGPSIQRANQRALRARTTLRSVLALVRAFRSSPERSEGEGDPAQQGGGAARDARAGVVESAAVPLAARAAPSPPSGVLSPAARGGDLGTPIILMGYLNPVLTYGYEAFARDAAEAGVDGLIVVDCPPEEASGLADALDAAGIALIRLTAPTTDDARLAVVARRTSGFVYHVSVAGVTGVKSAVAADIAPAVERVRAASGLPVAVGFGIRNPNQAAAVARVADAAVVGSALVDEIAAALDAAADPVSPVAALAAELAQAVRAARLEP